MADIRMGFGARKRKRQNGGRAAKRARSVPFRGRRAVANGEKKFLDTVKADTALTVAGVIFDDSLNHIAQGVTESERLGRKVVIHSLHLKGKVSSVAVTTIGDTGNRYRILIYQDKQANGATAAVTDVLETATIDSFRNLSNIGRFRVLYDKTKNLILPAYVQTAAGTFSSTRNSYQQSVNVRLNIPIEFDNTFVDGRIGTIRSNNIGILGLCDDDTAAPVFGYVVRIRFTDQ